MERVGFKIEAIKNLGIAVNLEWAETIVKELIKQGVRNFCMGYGNRSTPLIVAVAHHPLAKTHTHFDERGLGFFALGLAKSLKEPVALVVTSGTALGNLYPAVMESYHDQIPLVILTADRPIELYETGANQSCKQTDFFSSYTRFFYPLPTPDPSLSLHYLQSTVAHLVHRSLFPIAGPVQLNCPFREPFYDQMINQTSPAPFSTHYTTPTFKLEAESLSFVFEQVDLWDEGIILVGKEEGLEIQSLIHLSKHLNFPIFTEVHSNARFSDVDSIIPFPNLTLKYGHHFDCEKPKIVLLFGQHFISKEIEKTFTHSKIECVIQISSYPFKSDPSHFVHHRIIATASDFCDLACSALEKKPFSHYFQKWSLAAKKIAQAIDLVLDQTTTLSEPVLPLLFQNLQNYDQSFFISNSLPIRYMNDYFHLASQRSALFCNRGLSGIDGNIATAIGIQKGLESPLICLLGDLATLHDLNSFALLQRNQKIVFIICNNSGGAIFNQVAPQQSKEILNRYFIGEHRYQFDKIAETFQIPYLQVDSIDALNFGLNQFFEQKSPLLIELIIRYEENTAFESAIESQIQNQKTGSSIKSYFFS